jgi:hypothetical protein
MGEESYSKIYQVASIENKCSGRHTLEGYVKYKIALQKGIETRQGVSLISDRNAVRCIVRI